MSRLYGDFMRRVIAAAVMACLPSCMFIVTKDRKRDIKSTEAWNVPTPITSAVPSITAQPRDGGLDIQVTWKRTCAFTGDRIIEQRISTGATLEVYDWCDGDGCEYVYIFAILAAPITLAVSGLFTGIAVATSDDRSAVIRKPLPVRHGACDAAGANIPLVVETPSSVMPQLVTTDAAGRARVELGSDDATHATVTIAR